MPQPRRVSVLYDLYYCFIILLQFDWYVLFKQVLQRLLDMQCLPVQHCGKCDELCLRRRPGNATLFAALPQQREERISCLDAQHYPCG